MTSDLLDLDDIAADDALIESVRSGAVRDDLPKADPAVDILLAVRDGAQAPIVEHSADVGSRRTVASRIVSHRRAIAVSVIAGVAVTTGVGAAVAGDPTAAFKYVFDRGVEIGSRFGTPGGSSSSAGELIHRPHAVGVSSPAIRQGSAAGPLGDTRDDASVGFVRDPDYWQVPTPRSLEEYTDGDSDSSGSDGISTTGGVVSTEADQGDSQDGDGPVVTTDDPTGDTSGPQEEDPETDGSGPTDDPTTLIVPPTDGTTETTTPPPTETATTPPPTETTTPPPTETTEPPTETTAPPTETTTPPETTAPTSSEPTTTTPDESPTAQ